MELDMLESDLKLRPAMLADLAAVTRVVTAAFGSPGEAQLIGDLDRAGALYVSLVAAADEEIVGHVALSPVMVTGQSGGDRWLGLAPLAVAPAWQRRGIGSALVLQAVAIAGERGASAVFVLGRSRFYERLGFAAAAALGWRCAYDVPEPAFRVLRLLDPPALPPPGKVSYHAAFDAL